MDLKNYEYKGYTVRIVPDEDAADPITDRGAGAIYSTIYANGKSIKNVDELGWNWEKTFDENVEDLRKEYLVAKVWRYKHTGICYATGENNPFNDPWDSCLFGIFVFDQKKYEEMGLIYSHESFPLYAKAIIEDYNKYINGEVCGYIIEYKDELQDSCWGYYDEDQAESDAKEYIDNCLEDKTAVDESPKDTRRNCDVYRTSDEVYNAYNAYVNADFALRVAEGRVHDHSLDLVDWMLAPYQPCQP